jgi:protein phosphatase-4 regulatory subunit 3
MKFFLLKTRVLGDVLKLLRPHPHGRGISGDRCLKLAALRFLRAVLSVNDEFYHRHIIQHDLFAPVFEAFRANPVGDNLVSSAVVEMCHYIQVENIKSLLEYIVTKHLSSTNHPENSEPSLEDVSGVYVDTLTNLRRTYENNATASQRAQDEAEAEDVSSGGSRYIHGGGLHHAPRHYLSDKALEDQRKFQELDEEESYFESDDKEESSSVSNVPAAPVDDVGAAATQQVEGGELHRTPRMFSLAQAPLLSSLDENAQERDESTKPDEIIGDSDDQQENIDL